MTAILAVWNDRDPAGATHFERWYNRQHLEERVGTPGFRFGRRYEAIKADRQFFCFYEVDDSAVLSSPEYLRRQNNPTDWTRQAMTGFRHMSRTVCDVAFTAGMLEGAHAVTLRWSGEAAASAELKADLAALAGEDGVGKLHLWAASREQTPHTAEMDTRRERDETITGAIVAECLRAEDTMRLASRLDAIADDRLGPGATRSLGRYRLLCILHHAAVGAERATHG